MDIKCFNYTKCLVTLFRISFEKYDSQIPEDIKGDKIYTNHRIFDSDLHRISNNQIFLIKKMIKL